MKHCEECLKELDKKDMPYKCFNRGYTKAQIDLKLNEEKIRADELRKVILKLSESEETMLSDKQYYTLMELKEQKWVGE